MLVKRTQELDTDTFKEGDKISLNCKNGRSYTATAVETDNGKTLFILDQILDNCSRMDSKNDKEVSWEDSELREKANMEILGIFPDEIKALIFSVKNNGYLFPPSREMIFKTETNPEASLNYFQDPKNITATRKGKPGCYWLKNPRKTACFYYINENGKEDSTFADCSFIGFRPMFCLRDPISLKPDISESTEHLGSVILKPESETETLDTASLNSFSEENTYKTAGLPDSIPNDMDNDTNSANNIPDINIDKTIDTNSEYNLYHSNPIYPATEDSIPIWDNFNLPGRTPEIDEIRENLEITNPTDGIDKIRNELEERLAELRRES